MRLRDEDKTREILLEELARLREEAARMGMEHEPHRDEHGPSDESGRYYKSLIDSTLDMVTVLDRDGRVLFNSRSLKDYLGYEPEELNGRYVFDLVHPDDRGALIEGFMRSVAVMAPTEYMEYRFLHKDGSWRFLESIGNNLLDDPYVNGIVVASRDVTERKRMEQKLEMEHGKMLSIFDSIDEAIYVADPHSCEILYVNRALKNIIGKDPTGSLCHVEFQGQEEPCEFCTNPVLLANPGEPYRWEYHNPKLGRNYFIIDRLIRWPDGRDVRFELGRDVTELKRIGADLRRSEEYFQAVTENAMDIIMIIGPTGEIMYINRAAQHLLGYDPQELIGRNGLELIHPDDVGWASTMIETAVGDPDYSPLRDLRVRHKDGTWRCLEGVGRNFLEHPAVRGIVLSLRDVTAQRRAEEELRDSEEMYKTLVRISPDAITVADLQGRITFVSPQTLAMNAYESEDELLGRSAIIFIDPVDHEKATNAYRKTLQEGTVRNIELTGVLKGGERFIAELNAALIRDVRGEPKNIVAFSRDISERKRLEKELQERNEELEAFAHTISHDLLSPVAIVEGYAKAALEADAEGRGEAERECLEAIARGARRMSDLINSLLQYAQAGHVDTGPCGVDAEEILMEVLIDLDEEIQSREARIELDTALPRVAAGAVKLRQVFGNLVGNALKHMGNCPEQLIKIGASDQGDMAIFYVSDNGTGIPPELHDKVFEPFRHFSLAGSQGLGIGLSTVKRAVKAWGGKVWVESTPGKGAAFFFTVPLSYR